eukprot:CAMPEP_0114109012 /NCGR_PEP_ID=MMETSP0043_2-20121206/539_1 /TAXON_ID=464988 /ORGANISM="Hemiselmis andersenii, Strain CCMP644" /LENGTH=383 /DNA_ID=CAMNT_0001200841 /DNA_START=100 /DNA_END=1251 /DNA_ORIENTATION=+
MSRPIRRLFFCLLLLGCALSVHAVAQTRNNNLAFLTSPGIRGCTLGTRLPLIAARAKGSSAPSRCGKGVVKMVLDSGEKVKVGAKSGGYLTMEDIVGKTPLVRLARMDPEGEKRGNVILCKLEGNNPAGSVKDRPALNMIMAAEERGDIKPGDTLIEATSGNTGIALAMAAAIRGYKMILIMPDNMTEERRATMRVYGAELVSVPKSGGMERARDLALEMEAEGKGLVLNQFGNIDNPDAHFQSTGPEVWNDTDGRVTHFVSSMGTTGTIMGVSRYLKEKNPEVRICGVTPEEGSSIPGIRRWPKEYLPTIFEESRVDQTIEVNQKEAEETSRRLAREEGIFCGISSGGTVAAAIRLSQEVENATIVTIICDRGDRYLSTGVF